MNAFAREVDPAVAHVASRCKSYFTNPEAVNDILDYNDDLRGVANLVDRYFPRLGHAGACASGHRETAHRLPGPEGVRRRREGAAVRELRRRSRSPSLGSSTC